MGLTGPLDFGASLRQHKTRIPCEFGRRFTAERGVCDWCDCGKIVKWNMCTSWCRILTIWLIHSYFNVISMLFSINVWLVDDYWWLSIVFQVEWIMIVPQVVPGLSSTGCHFWDPSHCFNIVLLNPQNQSIFNKSPCNSNSKLYKPLF